MQLIMQFDTIFQTFSRPTGAWNESTFLLQIVRVVGT